MRAYLDFWKNYVNFSGKTGRKDYWLAVLWNVILLSVMYLLSLLGDGWNIAMAVVIIVYYLAVIIPCISLEIRRLRDGNFHWAFYFVRFVPLLGNIASIILACQPSYTPPEQVWKKPVKERFYN